MLGLEGARAPDLGVHLLGPLRRCASRTLPVGGHRPPVPQSCTPRLGRGGCAEPESLKALCESPINERYAPSSSSRFVMKMSKKKKNSKGKEEKDVAFTPTGTVSTALVQAGGACHLSGCPGGFVAERHPWVKPASPHSACRLEGPGEWDSVSRPHPRGSVDAESRWLAHPERRRGRKFPWARPLLGVKLEIVFG